MMTTEAEEQLVRVMILWNFSEAGREALLVPVLLISN